MVHALPIQPQKKIHMETFIVPQTGNELQFTSIEAACATMNTNFINCADAVYYEQCTDVSTNKTSFTVRDADRKIIFYAKQK